MILVSSCLLGLDTKYDGNSNANELLKKYSNRGKFIPFCPEMLGGLPTPRPSSEIIEGSGEDVLCGSAKVMSKEGKDETENYIRGAMETAKLIELFPVTCAIMKQRSPSCGKDMIYDGTFSGSKRIGKGVAAAMLQRYNIPIYTEEEITEEMLEKILQE